MEDVPVDRASLVFLREPVATLVILMEKSGGKADIRETGSVKGRSPLIHSWLRTSPNQWYLLQAFL